MSYTRFRFIGYEMPTVTLDETDPEPNTIYRIPPGQIPDTALANIPELQGHHEKLSSDAKTRIQRFLGALSQARNEVVNNGARYGGADDNTTLKIFMAPEFYFRPDNKEQSYSLDEYKIIKEVLTKTIANADSDDFKHWLVICGTIMYRQPITTILQNDLKSKKEYAYFNTCLYIRGDWDAYEKGEIEKLAASPIDGLPTGLHGGNFEVDDSKKPASQLFKKYMGLDYRRKHLFKINNVRCGLEICFEHIVNSYKENDRTVGSYGVLKDLFRYNNEYQVQLQFLPAGGMPISPLSITATAGNGYIMRNDGFELLSNSGVELKKVNRYNLASFNSRSNMWSLGQECSPHAAKSFASTTPVILRDVAIPNDFKIPKPDEASQTIWAIQSQRLRISAPIQLT